MARKFRKKPGLGMLSLPGMAGLGNDTIVEGDEYARFCPAVLEEVFDNPPVKKAVKEAPKKAEPKKEEPKKEKLKKAEPKKEEPKKEKPKKEKPVKEALPSEEDWGPGDAAGHKQDEEEEEFEPPNLNWLKSELTEYAEGLGLTVDKTMTKAQILEAIEIEEASE